jgi:Tfp pilus assembly protein PilF
MKRAKFLCLLLLCALPLANAQVRVWQGTLTLPTYEEGLPDPNPPFDQYATGRFNYPYTLRRNITNRRTDHAWRTLFLENEYLKCSVLPDLGGHLYTCTDKISGKPMFYENPSIKKANIGYRGAWAAFGIEFNFPVSHNWVSLSPVDFAYKKNDDGSGSVLVSNIDRVYGMQWTVELVLRPRSTVLEERVTLNNRSDVRHRFYWWNNAGVQVWDDSHIEYPMRFAASHGFRDVQPWPIEADGTDLSVIKNQTKGPVSLFVHGSREPFMGVWNPHTKTGTVHYADYAQLPAKKIWSWGVDADGLDWRKALSDNNSAYVEVQAGLFRNQETYSFLEPRQTISFSEYWMPVRDVGGISRANLAGVVRLSRSGNALTVGLNVNQPVPGATLRMLLGDNKVVESKSDIVPEHSWSHEIPNADSQRKYTFELLDRNGAVLLRHTEGENDWTPPGEIHVGPQPAYQIPESASRSEDDWVQLGNQQELDGNLLKALQTYEDGLKKFPQGFALQKAAGRLCAGLLRFKEAKGYLEAVHARDTTDAEISYYVGISLEGVGQARGAREAYEAAFRSPQFRAAAGLRLGELSARENNLNEAEYYLEVARRSAPDDLRAAEELVAVLRAAGKRPGADKLAQEPLTRSPLDDFLLEDVRKPDLQHLADDSERLLNVASEYMRLGLYARALEILSREYPAPAADQSEPGSLAPQKHPMVAYFRGYCREKLGQSGQADFTQASKLSSAYVFPSRAEDLEVLNAALRANSDDATAHYLLGTLYFSRGLAESGITEWEQARKLNSNIPVLHASLGRALLEVKKNPEQALKVFQEGLDADSRNEELYTGIDQALSILRHPAQERVAALERYPDRATMPSPLVYELILNFAEAGEFDKALALFHNRFFEREEGGTNVRQVWLEVQLQHALSLARHGLCSEAVSVADHVSDPVPDLPFTHDGLEPFLGGARTNYLLGTVYRVCNLREKANARLEHAAHQSSLEEALWAWKASIKLVDSQPGQSNQNLQDLVQRAKSASESGSHPGWWLYNLAVLERATGHNDQAQSEFRDALLSPDEYMSYHLTRLAQAEDNASMR